MRLTDDNLPMSKASAALDQNRCQKRTSSEKEPDLYSLTYAVKKARCERNQEEGFGRDPEKELTGEQGHRNEQHQDDQLHTSKYTGVKWSRKKGKWRCAN